MRGEGSALAVRRVREGSSGKRYKTAVLCRRNTVLVVFHVFMVILTCFESRVFKIFSARAFGARECLIAFIDGRRAQNQQIRESMRLAYLGKPK